MLEVLEQNPPKQGLKHNKFQTLFCWMLCCFRAKSTKTRIETGSISHIAKSLRSFRAKSTKTRIETLPQQSPLCFPKQF